MIVQSGDSIYCVDADELCRRYAESGMYYRGYTPDTSDDEARTLFRRRYGCEPAEVHRSRSLVLAGPVPER